MISELSQLGKKLRTLNEKQHNALKEEKFNIELIISEDGSFEKFSTIPENITIAEAIIAKKGKARLLLDKAEEVLCYKNNLKKHELFLNKLKEYDDLIDLKPVFAFYENNRINGAEKALANFENMVPEKERSGNIAFRISRSAIRLHEEENVKQKIIEKYEAAQKNKLIENQTTCSICGKSDNPVMNEPHGMIKKVPAGQTSGCALVSYNEKAFESYYLKGNENSSICTNCARLYVEALNWLLSNGSAFKTTDKKGKEKDIFKYSNRQNFGSDMAIVFWTRQNQLLPEIDYLEQPSEKDISNLIEAVTSGETKKADYVDTDQFYSFALSGAAARIAIRDWIETSLPDFRKSIVQWFKDIAIECYNSMHKKNDIHYSRLYDLAACCQNINAKEKTILSRIALHLWNAALKNSAPPLWILATVLKRARLEKIGVTCERAALIRLILNRNSKGGIMIQKKLDSENTGIAYIAGQIFAILESIQWYALGDINAGIRDRFFSFASTNPSPAFGRLFKLSQNHLSKLKGEKPGLAVNLDKELQNTVCKLTNLPLFFTLEEQGQFAIGYYHKKQQLFNKSEYSANKKEEENE